MLWAFPMPHLTPRASRRPIFRHSARTTLAASLAVVFWFLGLAALSLQATAAELRVWISADGEHTTIAELVEVQGEIVTLKKFDGQTVRVPLSRLSEADREFLKEATNLPAGGLEKSEPAPSPWGDEDPVAEQPESEGSTSEEHSDPPKVSGDGPQTAQELELEAAESQNAKGALLLYKFFIENPQISESERNAAKLKLRVWQERAAKGLVRLGSNWVTKAEAEAARKKADAKIEMAIEYLRLSNGPLAEQTLLEASRLDPGSIKANFVMGLVYGLVVNDDRRATKHFEECIRRDPANVAALNNLAISQTFTGQYSKAAKNWALAAYRSPDTKVLSQNIGCLLSVADSRKVNLARRDVEALSEVYQKLILEHRQERPEDFVFVYLPAPGMGKGGSEGSEGVGGSVVVGSGSGFVVAPHIVVTNEHVVKGGDSFLVVDPKNPDAKYAATVLEQDSQLDVAVLRCDGLNCPPVPLCSLLPARSSDVMVLGFPLGDLLGSVVKATRGTMVAMPDPTNDNLCLYDALTNPGNSGGPLCDNRGRVVGIVRVITGAAGGQYGGAIPIEQALGIIQRHAPGLVNDQSTGPPLPWTEVDRLVSRSTVMVLTKENIRSDIDWRRGR